MPRRRHPLPAAVLALPLLACGGGAIPAAPDTRSPQEIAAAACATAAGDAARLDCLLAAWDITPLEAPPAVPDDLYNAGVLLFSSTLLSGAGTVSCASCHPTNNSGSEVGVALHASLEPGGGTIARNAPDLVNRLLGGRTQMFWDGRVALADGGYATPAGDKLPAGLDSLLAAQALFPLLNRDEMLGYADDGADANTLADLLPNEATIEADPQPVWDGIVARVRGDPRIWPLLQSAYPEFASGALGIAQIANALAALETRRWNATPATTYFNGYLSGQSGLTARQLSGALLFFDAGCARCHHGPLFSDGRYHNLGVPQLGPGAGAGAGESPPRDRGRYEISGDPAERYAFLTPSLWEAANSAPYLHNGVYADLAQVVRHHLDAAAAARAFRCADDAPAGVACRDSISDAALYDELLANLDPLLADGAALDDGQIAALVDFLEYLRR